MAKSLCRLLMKVNNVIVAIFYVENMSFNAIRENKILAKFPNLQYAGIYNKRRLLYFFSVCFTICDHKLPLCFLMDFTIHVDTIEWDCPFCTLGVKAIDFRSVVYLCP